MDDVWHNNCFVLRYRLIDNLHDKSKFWNKYFCDCHYPLRLRTLNFYGCEKILEWAKFRNFNPQPPPGTPPPPQQLGVIQCFICGDREQPITCQMLMGKTTPGAVPPIPHSSHTSTMHVKRESRKHALSLREGVNGRDKSQGSMFYLLFALWQVTYSPNISSSHLPPARGAQHGSCNNLYRLHQPTSVRLVVNAADF